MGHIFLKYTIKVNIGAGPRGATRFAGKTVEIPRPRAGGVSPRSPRGAARPRAIFFLEIPRDAPRPRGNAARGARGRAHACLKLSETCPKKFSEKIFLEDFWPAPDFWGKKSPKKWRRFLTSHPYAGQALDVARL